ncbi:MAG TPA: hypothetical protein VNM37_03085 [Candidatus Dormibacteraeota bacterium]|nr:hypothetical protein [Candidatus Dormibacteraeota bacterium]
MTEYPAATLLIDDYLGLEIQFDSLDNELDEYPFTEAQQNRLLVSEHGWSKADNGVRSGYRSLNYDEVTVRKV